MSWVTRLEQQIIIRTGDGVEHRPQWLNAVQQQEFNVTVFNYIDVQGSQVRRNEARSRQFPIEFYFLGENNIEDAERFRISTTDRRPWTIFHPFYDQILVHPISLRYDNTGYNCTTITGTLVETIGNIFPRETGDVTEQITLQKNQLDENYAEVYGQQTDGITGPEINDINSSLDQLEANTNTLLDDADDQVDFRNLVLDAQRDINNILTDPIAALRSIQAVINFPFQVEASVRARIDNLITAFEDVVQSTTTIAGISRNNKVYNETIGAGIISAMTTTAITNATGQTRVETQSIIDDIQLTYEQYIAVIDQYETDTQTQVNSYAANEEVQRALGDLMTLTLAALQEITLEGAQEIVIVNEKDSNPVLLTHRVYGLDDEDVNLNRFIETNDIGLNELLLIKKGRELVYYV